MSFTTPATPRGLCHQEPVPRKYPFTGQDTTDPSPDPLKRPLENFQNRPVPGLDHPYLFHLIVEFTEFTEEVSPLDGVLCLVVRLWRVPLLRSSDSLQVKVFVLLGKMVVLFSQYQSLLR